MKRTASRFALVMILSLALIPLGGRTAVACSCASPLPDTASVEEHDVVFAGYVIAAEYPKEVRNVDDTLGKIRWTFLPDTLIKGLDPGPIEVLSHSQAPLVVSTSTSDSVTSSSLPRKPMRPWRPTTAIARASSTRT